MSNPINPFEKILSDGLSSFEGLRITGTIPLRDDVINEIITGVLQNGVPMKPASSQPAAPQVAAESPKIDVNALLKCVKRAQVKSESGRVVIDFEISV